MATSGPGLVGARQIVLAARRLRVTYDAGMFKTLALRSRACQVSSSLPPEQPSGPTAVRRAAVTCRP